MIKALGFDPEDLPALFGAPELGVTALGHAARSTAQTMMTSLDGVFAAGDIVRGACLVVWAIRDGRDAAEAIHSYLKAKAARRAIAADDDIATAPPSSCGDRTAESDVAPSDACGDRSNSAALDMSPAHDRIEQGPADGEAASASPFFVGGQYGLADIALCLHARRGRGAQSRQSAVNA